MTVAEEQESVRAGSLVYVPKETVHSLRNTGTDNLDYFVLENHD